MFNHIKDKLGKAFTDLIFEVNTHTYCLHGELLISVSKKVESHYDKFDAAKMLPFSARKASLEESRDVTVGELAHRWQTINKTACDLGHETHDYLEAFEGIQTPSTAQQQAGVKFLEYLLNEHIPYGDELIRRYEILYRELPLFSELYSYAGTPDLLLWDYMSNTIVIVDYKTNKNLWKTYGMLNTPFEFLECHPYNKYQLQLSYYQIMLEEAGFTVGQRLLAYLKSDSTYEVYPLSDFTLDLRVIMEHKEYSKDIIEPLWN